jgi:hypothetical protein
MQRTVLIVLGLAGTLALTAPAAAKPQLTVDAAQGADFTPYKTYSWVASHPPGGINAVQYQRIMANLDTRMNGKGWQRGDPADLTMALTLGKRQKIDLDAWNHWGYRDAYGHTEGQVSVDVFDAKTKQALWHGQITDAIDPRKPDPEKLDAALAKLMEQFPGK